MTVLEKSCTAKQFHWSFGFALPNRRWQFCTIHRISADFFIGKNWTSFTNRYLLLVICYVLIEGPPICILMYNHFPEFHLRRHVLLIVYHTKFRYYKYRFTGGYIKTVDCFCIDVPLAVIRSIKETTFIGSMELILLHCIHHFTQASSYGFHWYQYSIASRWYQWHTPNKFPFSLMLRDSSLTSNNELLW